MEILQVIRIALGVVGGAYPARRFLGLTVNFNDLLDKRRTQLNACRAAASSAVGLRRHAAGSTPFFTPCEDRKMSLVSKRTVLFGINIGLFALLLGVAPSLYAEPSNGSHGCCRLNVQEEPFCCASTSCDCGDNFDCDGDTDCTKVE